jgi:tRNA A37 threonylcarbamoyltransferase TsaD
MLYVLKFENIMISIGIEGTAHSIAVGIIKQNKEYLS